MKSKFFDSFSNKSSFLTRLGEKGGNRALESNKKLTSWRGSEKEPSLLFFNSDGRTKIALHHIGPDVPERQRKVPILCIPGIFSDNSFYNGTRDKGLARFLSSSGFECYSLDPRGQGLSSKRSKDQRWHVAGSLSLALFDFVLIFLVFFF